MMPALRRLMRPLLMGGAVATFLVTGYYGVLYRGQLPYHWRVDGYNDTLLHIGSFGLLAMFAAALRTGWSGFAALVVFAGLIEVAQIWVSGRTASAGDFAAGVIGVLLGFLAVRAILTFVRWKQLEKTAH